MTRPFPSFPLLLTFAAAPLAFGQEPTPLSAHDAAFLSGLRGSVVVTPPPDARWVEVSVPLRSVWGERQQTTRAGWLDPRQPERVLLCDGAWAPVTSAAQPLDFVAACRARFAAPPRPGATSFAFDDSDDSDRAFADMEQEAVGGPLETPALAMAVFLHDRGEEALAARALAAARGARRGLRPSPEDDAALVAAFRGDRAWTAFAGLVHAYMVRADAEALRWGEHLLARYGDLVDGEEGSYRQARAIVAELRRRQEAGTFGVEPPGEPPAGFADSPLDEQVATLISWLDEVDARQWGQPGGVPLGSDWRVQALIAIGDPAVPALIDAIEHDRRLTRSVHFWRDFSHDRTMLGVREAALTAVLSILRVEAFAPASTGDNFTKRGEEGADRVVEYLRAYWARYGATPFDERMMNVLTDPEASFAARREAAQNLAQLTTPRDRGTTFASGGWLLEGDPGPNPAIAKFSGPTCAEAILTAYEAERGALEGAPRAARVDLERHYLRALVDLGDGRVAEVLAEGAAGAATLGSRRRWAVAAFRLGAEAPLRALADELAQGTLRFLPESTPRRGGFAFGDPADDEPLQPGGAHPLAALRALVADLLRAEAPFAGDAVAALLAPEHPGYALARSQVEDALGGFSDDVGWLSHPACLPILRARLDEDAPAGGTYRLDGDGTLVHEVAGGGTSWSGLPEALAQVELRPRVVERRWHAAAAALSERLGLADFHPLRADAGAWRERLRDLLDRYRFRPLTPAEASALRAWQLTFAPDLPPLDRAATAADVAAGRAIFALPGGQGPLPFEAPWVLLRGDERVLVLQAERDAAGRPVYGVVGPQSGVTRCEADAVREPEAEEE